LKEYVPTSHNPDALVECSTIKCNSRLEPGTLQSTRWVKPVQRRATGQQVAHLIARFTSVSAANQAIQVGVIIAGKRVWARCMHKELRRCLKCQVINTNHLTADCMWLDRCGTCGGGHRMAKCTETDRDKFQCVNCNVGRHMSWDWLWFRFVEGCKKIERTDSEHTYNFFPRQELWTWEQEGPLPWFRNSTRWLLFSTSHMAPSLLWLIQ